MKVPFRTVALLGLLGASLLLSGMAGRGTLRRGELRPEIRVKIYSKAIDHYEKAKSLHEAGYEEEALRELRKATKVYSRFPEAYQLAREIYLKLGKPKEAQEQEVLLRYAGGAGGASPYELRQRAYREIEVRKANAPPPDIEPAGAFLLSGASVALLLLGMIFEYWRLNRSAEERGKAAPIFLERFPSDQEGEVTTSSLFKLYVLLLPAPVIFSLLVLFGFRYYTDLWPLFCFSWAIVDVTIYLIFFADLRDLGGFRRPRGAT